MYNKKLIGFFLIALILAVCIGTASASENTTLTSANEEKTFTDIQTVTLSILKIFDFDLAFNVAPFLDVIVTGFLIVIFFPWLVYSPSSSIVEFSPAESICF